MQTVMTNKRQCTCCGKENQSDDRRVMNPFLDWSFKYIFGTEQSKSNLIGFLNLLLMPQSLIVDLEYMNNEVIPVSEKLKGCVFDIICKDANGDKYLIEMQNSQVENIRERIIFYTCRLIDRMGQKGDDWDYAEIKRVYSICLMNFNYESNPVLRRDIQLYDVNERKPFSDKLNIILLQMPCTNDLNLGECNKYYENLLILLQQMHNGMKTIDELKQEVADTQLPEATKKLFYEVLDTAHLGSLPEEDRMRYESDLKNYRDTMSCIRFAKKEGIAEGIELGIERGIERGIEQGIEQGAKQEKINIARSMKADGIDAAVISKYSGLALDEIENLK